MKQPTPSDYITGQEYFRTVRLAGRGDQTAKAKLLRHIKARDRRHAKPKKLIAG